MIYALGGYERLSMQADGVQFSAINFVDFLPLSVDGKAPCPVDRFIAPVFRLQSRNPTELFCISGFEVPFDEFKPVYDHFGFEGLTFEEIWSDDAI